MESHFNLNSPMNYVHTVSPFTAPRHDYVAMTCSYLRAFARTSVSLDSPSSSLTLPRSLLKCHLVREASQTSYVKVQPHTPKPRFFQTT